MGEVPPIVHEVLRSPGQPLDAATRAFMEPRFAHDFSQVRIHTNAQAAESARAMNARAYTVGPHVVFAAGRYSPETSRGRELLAHELAHVVQQRETAATIRPIEIDAHDSPAEQEASRLALAGGAPLATVDRPILARQVIEEEPFEREEEEREEREEREPRFGEAEPPIRDGQLSPELMEQLEQAWEDLEREEEAREQARREGPPIKTPETPRVGPIPAEPGAPEPFFIGRVRLELERPVATLRRGGSSPTFITAEPPVIRMIYYKGVDYPVTFRPHLLHVLDAIEFEVGRARFEDDLRRILTKYLGFLPPRRIFEPLPLIPIMEPVLPSTLDPDRSARLDAYLKAVSARIKAVPGLALEPSAMQLTGEAEKRGCRRSPAKPLGNDPIANFYAEEHCRFGSPFETRLKPPLPSRFRGVQFDGLGGDIAYECKCGYQWVADDYFSSEPWKRARAFKYLDAAQPEEGKKGKPGLSYQLLNQQRLCRECGYRHRLVVSNPNFARVLRDYFSGYDFEIEEVGWEPCGWGTPSDELEFYEELNGPIR